MAHTEFDQGWSLMLTGITKLKRILEGEPEPPFDSQQYMNLYSTIYTMCTQKSNFSAKLYDKYREEIQDYVAQTVLPSIMEKHGEYTLRELGHKWENHKILIKWLTHFFNYLNRYHIKREGLPTLNEVGLACFRDLVYGEMHSKATESILALIHKEREGGEIDRTLLKSILNLYVEIGIGKMEQYEEDFESFMLRDTAYYYSLKASSWLQEDTFPEYMLKCEECLKKERERVTHYLELSTEPKLVEKVQNELLVVFGKQLLENEHSGLNVLLGEDKVDDISRMYSLYHTIPAELQLAAGIFNQHVTAKGKVLIQEAEDAVTNQAAASTAGGVNEQLQVLVKKLIELHDKYMFYVTEYFQANNVFLKAFRDAFEILCNKNVGGSSSAEILATFCDNILKKGGNESDEVIEDTLEKVVTLLAHITDKDLFAEFYRKKQARRLLFDRIGNEDHEKSMISKLKDRHGVQFTSKMDGMVTDVILARESQKKFEEYLTNTDNNRLGFDLSVTVLTTGFWPTYKTSDLHLPTEMVKGVEVFKEFYEKQTKSRRLVWIYSLGSCHITANFNQKPIDLIVSTYQAAVLLLFNNTERLSYNEISEQLNLTNEDVMRLLHSLSCAKYKILNKEPSSKSISKTDVFEFNSSFTNKMRRIKIPLPPRIDERKKVKEDVDKERKYAIEAAIVRIMKSRKVLGHQQLLSECVQYLSRTFKPDIKNVKKGIEDLIDREFLERDTQNPNTFKYLA